MNDWFGIYNGIDYLMLHNLYWLTMLPYSGIVSIGNSDADYWRNLANHETNLAIAASYNSFADFILYTDQNQRRITSTRTIPKGYEINYTVAESIDLVPGFTAEKESCFDASINSDWVYEKTDYSVLPNSNTCFDAIPFSIPNTTIAVPALASAISNSEVTSSLKSDIEQSNGLNSVEIKQSISMEPIVEKVQLHVAPNPNTGNFKITLLNNIGPFTAKIYNVTGVELYSFSNIDDNSIPVNIESSGLYFLTIDNGKELFHQRIVCK